MINCHSFRDTYLHPSEIRILPPCRYVSAPLRDTYLDTLQIRICKHPRYVSANTQDAYLPGRGAGRQKKRRQASAGAGATVCVVLPLPCASRLGGRVLARAFPVLGQEGLHVGERGVRQLMPHVVRGAEADGDVVEVVGRHLLLRVRPFGSGREVEIPGIAERTFFINVEKG